ncbi:PREDICTED: uncharacterized protein LOC109471862 isoform X2 [Branchiostoma belcheri]|uniref:Uncharacterized protein LOC109471862 isoform X2 n=1 Tax=Branchiostoma belcheri TaxID=7741 RepID=A0A6P4YR14_BRABE|nr:PREDICTED: uncharacterized protein LOC109471862 isoform X2 [Branchiostoma belcheri]
MSKKAARTILEYVLYPDMEADENVASPKTMAASDDNRQEKLGTVGIGEKETTRVKNDQQKAVICTDNNNRPQQEDEVSDVVIQAVFGDHISPEQVKAGIKFNPLYSENANSNAARTHYGTYNYLDVHHLRSLHTKEAAPEFHSPESHHIGTNGDVIVPNGSEKPAFVQLDAALRKSENGPRKNGILANGPAGKQKANGCVKWAPLPQLVKSASLQKSNNARTQDKNDNKEKKASSRLYDTTDAIMHGYDTLIWKTLEKKKRRYVLRAFLCVLGILILLGLFVMAVVLPLYFFNFLGG